MASLRVVADRHDEAIEIVNSVLELLRLLRLGRTFIITVFAY
jgi:hypothetical protein